MARSKKFKERTLFCHTVQLLVSDLTVLSLYTVHLTLKKGLLIANWIGEFCHYSYDIILKSLSRLLIVNDIKDIC